MARQRSWWIAALLLVVLAGAALVAWRLLRSDPAPAVAAAGDRARSDDEPDDADLTEVPAAAEASQEATALREVEARAPEDPAVARELAAGAAIKFGIAFTVVRHENGLPIGGALLVVLDERRVNLEEVAALARDPSELRRRASFFLRTDEDGLVQVPRPIYSAFVVGFADGRRGSTSVTSTTFGPQRLELFTPRQLTVAVVDEQRRPQAGVEVALAYAGRQFGDLSVRATTDAEGMAKLADLDLEPSLQSEKRKFQVGTTFPLIPPASVAVELDPPPKEPVVLTLPATGAIAFQLVDEQGEPLAVAGSLQLVAAATTESLAAATRRRPNDAQTTRVELDASGRANLARVGLLLQFKATPDLAERNSAALRFAGPTRAGETIEVALPAAAIGPLFTGRVVGGGDAPLSGADLSAELDTFDDHGRLASSDRAIATVGGDGSFRLDFSRAGKKGREGQLFLRAERDGRSPEEGKVTATLPPIGVAELGTIRLAPPPLLVAGLVVDDEGAPIEAAAIRVTAKLDPPVPFKVNHLPSLTTAADGLFELCGELPDGELSVGATRRGYLPMKSQPFTAGARDLTLTLRMGGTLAGSLLLPDGFDSDLLNARLTLPTTRWPVVEVQNVRADGSFRFPLLPAGLYKFELLLGRDVESAEPFATVNQVAVRPAELTRDVRLQELDLRSLLRIVEASVRVPGGALAEKGTVGRIAPGRNAKGPLTVPLREGRALIPCTSVPVDLQVAVPGFLVQTVGGVEGRVDVLMRRGLAVRFVVSGRLERRPDWIPVRVTPRPRDEALASLWPGDQVVLDHGEGGLILPAAGRYRARIDFGPPPGQNAPSGESRRNGRGTRSELDFDVKEVDREQVVELKVQG